MDSRGEWSEATHGDANYPRTSKFSMHPRHLPNLPRHQISGNFKTFTAYSTGSESIVLTGNIESDPAANLASPSTHTPPFKPTILPRLQSPHNSVISVVLGDYHFGCLTSTGKLLTWGAFSKGALGLGDPLDLDAGKPGGFNSQRDKNVAQTAAGSGHMPVTPREVSVPTEVRFDWEERKSKKEGREKYCFAATAAGWHMGALVIDLEVRNSFYPSIPSSQRYTARCRGGGGTQGV